MTLGLILAAIIVLVIIIIVLSAIRPCRCGCRSCRAGNCICGSGQCSPDPYARIELSPLTLPEPKTVGAKIIVGVDSQPQHNHSRTNHVGTWIQTPPDIIMFTEPIYSQHGDVIVQGELTGEPNLQAEHFTSQINNTRRVYLHYTDWCGYCKKMKPIWAQVKETLAESMIQFYEIDEDVAKTPGVNGYPTILMIDENGYRHQYPGGIEFESLRAWCVSPATKKTNA